MKGHPLSKAVREYALALSANGWTDGEVAALTGVKRKKPKQRVGHGLGDDCGGEPAEATDTRPGGGRG